MMPSVKRSAEPYPPWWVKIDARTATPNTPPSSRMALLAPDALPASSGRTAPRTTVATGAKKSAIPTPAIANGGTRSM